MNEHKTFTSTAATINEKLRSLFDIRSIGTDMYRISSAIKQAPCSLFIAACSHTAAMKNNNQDPSDNKEVSYVYAHNARRLKQQKKEQRKFRKRAIRKSSSKHRGCPQNEERNARPSKKSVSVQEDIEIERLTKRHDESRDDAPEDQRHDATDTEKRDFFLRAAKYSRNIACFGILCLRGIETCRPSCRRE